MTDLGWPPRDLSALYVVLIVAIVVKLNIFTFSKIRFSYIPYSY